MTFALEADLCSALQGAWPLHLGSEGRIDILREMRVGAVIPDQIVVRTRTDAHSESPLPRLTLFESEILAAFADGSRRPSSIASQLFARIERVRDVLDRLERHDLVCKQPGGSYARSRSSMPRHIEVIAVEAKLVRWRDAVEQAIEYQRFANRVYVALPRRTVEDNFLPCLDCCETHGLGLIAVEADFTEVLLHAESDAPLTAEWFWLVSRLSRLHAHKAH
jgi:hypothetical protein